MNIQELEKRPACEFERDEIVVRLRDLEAQDMPGKIGTGCIVIGHVVIDVPSNHAVINLSSLGKFTPMPVFIGPQSYTGMYIALFKRPDAKAVQKLMELNFPELEAKS